MKLDVWMLYLRVRAYTPFCLFYIIQRYNSQNSSETELRSSFSTKHFLTYQMDNELIRLQ